ncbi:hypothetical protein [[Mycobacterium] vasticus]|uniref:DUF3800 domain-containing protein n=1 Tax=[Mycobacterium] vasticus TaxID=2875777 RepID=A0ABU5YSX5_9MYCO|nr:hypothetical protein [Mycolicibacter sp. MYC017]MEB3068213.1 hypothetical protein [Mycolicibacter sp. MYC017]
MPTPTILGVSLTARHIFVDESKRREYFVVAAIVAPKDLRPLRRVVEDLLLPQQRYIHMKDEGDGRKQTIAKNFVGAGVEAIVYDAGQRYRTQLAARAACMRGLIEDLATNSDDTLIIIEQDDSLVHSDRRLLYEAVRAVGRADNLRYDHRRREAELLLGIPDAIAWCWAKGGRWRQHIEPAIRSVRSL